MGIPVCIMGRSGSGKSCSMRNCDPEKLAIFNVAGKPLPFRGKFPMMIKTQDVDKIISMLKKNTTNMYVIDDSQYLMAFKIIDKINEAGYKKYTEITSDFKRLIDAIKDHTSPDTIVYFLHHCAVDANGMISAKTTGQMIDNWVTFEGMFSIVLMAAVSEAKHYFVTQSDGTNTCKSPMGMFEYQIDNDLKMVDETIREYYELPPAGKRNPVPTPPATNQGKVTTTNIVPPTSKPAEKKSA